MKKKENEEYTLDITIPSGKQGEVGPQGKVGPIGPIGPTTDEDLAYLEFEDQTTESLTTISKSTILPSNSSFYSVGRNGISIAPGNYEYNLNGKLNNASLTIQIQKPDGTIINLLSISTQLEQVLFSRTRILSTNDKVQFFINFLKRSNNSKIENFKLIIKRLPF